MDDGLIYKVNSRRRGKSLGINLFPQKRICNYNCIYCFRGKTQTKKPNKKITPKKLKQKLKKQNYRDIKSVDFSGTGETTLHPQLKQMTKTAKKTIPKKVDLGIFTNSTKLSNKKTRNSLKPLNTIEAKLDTPYKTEYQKINKPTNTTHKEIIQGLKKTSKEFEGKLNIQTILINYQEKTNSTKKHAKEMTKLLRKIKPDKLHLYTAYRKTLKKDVKKVSKQKMKKYKKIVEKNLDLDVKVETYN